MVEGGVTKAIKRVGISNNLGTFTWYKYNTTAAYDNFYYCVLPSDACGWGSTTSEIPDRSSLSNGFVPRVNTGLDNIPNNGYTINSIPWLVVHFDTSIDTPAKAQAKMNNVYVTYYLKTYQTYILDNFNLPLNVKVWKSGTERYESSDSTGTSPKLIIHYNAQ